MALDQLPATRRRGQRRTRARHRKKQAAAEAARAELRSEIAGLLEDIEFLTSEIFRPLELGEAEGIAHQLGYTREYLIVTLREHCAEDVADRFCRQPFSLKAWLKS